MRRDEPAHEEAAAPAATTKATTSSAATKPTQSAPPRAPEPELSGVVIDKETAESFNTMWRERIAKDPENRHVYEHYIENNERRLELSQRNRSFKDEGFDSGYQSEAEMQFLYSTRHKRVPIARRPGSTRPNWTEPDGTFGTDWAIEVKNWNVLYPSREECQAAGSNRLPPRFQKLVDQVQDRRARFGDKQWVIIDVRGQLNLTGVSPEVRASNNELIMAVRTNIAAACKLPVAQVEVTVW